MEYRTNSIEGGPEGGRSLEDYEKILHFKKEELDGENILDLGAGPGARFSSELKESGINATVVSLSPDFKDAKHRQFLTEQGRKDELVLAGLGEALPFKDESFDKVLALFSVSIYSTNEKHWLLEVVRVLKPGGEARIGPFHPPRMDMYDGDILFVKRREMKEFIASLGLKYEYLAGPLKGQEVLVISKTPQSSIASIKK